MFEIEDRHQKTPSDDDELRLRERAADAYACMAILLVEAGRHSPQLAGEVRYHLARLLLESQIAINASSIGAA